MSLDHSTVRRLAFIRYLYSTGISQSHAPPPLSCASLLTMHDAVELFLQLASERSNVGSDRTGFMEYFKLLSEKLGSDLEEKESMRRLNNARVALKHHGTLPSELNIEDFCGRVTSFFNDNTPVVFGVSFAEISLVEYVNPEASRRKLKEAEQLLTSGDTLEALDNIALAFAEMIRDYEARKRDKFSGSPFHFGRGLTTISSSSMQQMDGSRSAQEAIRMLALGIDYKKYSKFRRLTPRVQSGKHIMRLMRHRPMSQSKPSVEDVRFCLDFVVESALTLSEFDYTVS
jgi:hypothetical protein